MKRKPRGLDKLDNMGALTNQRDYIAPRHKKAGTLTGKVPVRLDNKTVIYVRQGKDEQQVLNKYNNRHATNNH